MKRKFILYPAVALALMTSASLSSCVDTDEPESLANLRDAVAQREKAQAGYIDAKSEVEKAYVAVVNAKARLDEANAVAKELDNALTEAQNATKILEEQIKQAKDNAAKDSDVEAAKVKAENTLVTVKTTLEAAIVAYENAARKNEESLQADILRHKVALAKIADADSVDVVAYWTKKVLDKQDALKTKQDALADAVEAYDKTDRATLVAKIDQDTKDLEDAQAKLSKYTELFKDADYEAVITEWKELKAKSITNTMVKNKETEAKQKLDQAMTADGSKTLKKEKEELEGTKDKKFNEWNAYNGEESTDGTIKNLKKKVKDAEDAKNEVVKQIKDRLSSIDVVDNYNKEVIEIVIDCKNDALNALVDAKKPTDFNFTFDSKNKRYIKSNVKRSEIETTVATIRSLFFEFGDPLAYNEWSYEKIDTKFTDAILAAKNAIAKYDDGGVVNAWDKWKASITAMRNATTQTKLDEAKADYMKWAGIIFGTGPGTFATGIQAEWFFDGSICDFAENDKITSYILAKKVTGLDTKENVWDNLGLYGKWRKLYENNDRQKKLDAYEDAAKVIAAIDKYVSDYKEGLAQKEQIKNLGSMAYTDAEIAAMPEVTAAQKKVDDANAKLTEATTKQGEKWNEFLDAQNKLNNCEYNKQYAEIDKIYDDRVAGNDEANLTLISGFFTEVGMSDAVVKAFATVGEFEAYAKWVVAEKQKDVDKATRNLAYDQADLEAFDNGNYDQIASLKAKVKEVEQADKELKDAEASLEKAKSYVGK